MHNFGTIFLWTLAACILLQGSFVEDQSGYICLIEDPKQKQCDSICLTELSPRLSEVVTAQNEGNANTRESDNEIKSKLETLEVNIGKELAKLPQEVHAKLEGRLQGVENKLERQFQVQTKLEESLLVVQTKLEAVLNQLQTLSKNIDSAKVEIPFAQLNQVVKAQDLGNTRDADIQAKLNSVVNQQAKLEGQLQEVLNQLQTVSKNIDAANVENSDLVSLSGFERIGDRYFLIVHEKENWHAAWKRCRKIGGYIAAFRNDAELTAVKAKLKEDDYWIGIHDWGTEGHFLSQATDNPPQFLKWRKREPNDKNHEENCVVLHRDRGMWDHNCLVPFYFICQADNKT
ncbi:hypothetical protein KR059_008741 [Drosophila kikkawai]|nr:hypothetical protein KR059_008741 [Drosophila kikkawai]